MNSHQKFVVKLNFVLLLLLGLIPIFTLSQQFFVVLSDIDPNLKINQKEIADGASSVPEPTESDFDEFIAPEAKADYELDPGSWNPIFEPDGPKSSSYLNFSNVDGERENGSTDDEIYYKAVGKMVNAASRGDEGDMAEAASEIEAIAMTGHPHAQSVMGLLYGMGIMKERNKGKAFLNHYFAAEGGNMQSKMALAYTYYRQKMNDKAVKLYAELAETAVNSLLISKDPPAESIRIHSGTEENKEALRKSRGEEDEDFQITEYQALKGNAGAMYKIGYLYYFGLRGVRRDHAKAFSWFLKAVEKGEPRSMELLGEIYARGAGVERNYTKAFEWLTLATKHQHYSAYNGLGYLYVMGYGVEARNITMAKKYFIKAAKSEEPAAALYNLGVMFLKGIGVDMDLIEACNHFALAGNAGQIKGYYQLAKMFRAGIGVRENIFMAASLFKIVAERGPWSSMCRWALESYLKGDVGKALLLYSRLAELGYEVHQSNAAWILDKYGEHSMCMGESGICTEAERYQHSHALWWLASEQGNEHAALLIGDAYYYGRGIDRDYHRAAEAYFHAKSQANAQAMFNLGYMHERGEGLPVDLHLAKRYYDQALEKNPAAKLPVTLALASLWLRKNYADSFLIDMIDSLPDVYPKLEKWVEDVIMEEGNATILTLFVCLLTVLYLRERQRRHAVDRAGDMAPRQPIVEHHGLHAAH